MLFPNSAFYGRIINQSSLTRRTVFVGFFLLSFYNDILIRFEFLAKWKRFLWTKVVAKTASCISLWIASIESAVLLWTLNCTSLET